MNYQGSKSEKVLIRVRKTISKVIKEGKVRKNDQRGDKNHNSKLSVQDVVNIRESELTPNQLSKIYLISPNAISSIRRRERWKHV